MDSKLSLQKITLEKNDFIEVDIDDMGYEGEGIAHVQGAAVFIKNAIIGERVRAKIILAKKNFYAAIIDKIIRPSPHRVKPPCPYFGKCGGCDFMHIDYPFQLQLKKQSLENTLKKALKNIPIVQDVVPSTAQLHYRNKLSLPVRGEPASAGFFAKNSHRLVPIDDCLLQNFDAKSLIKIVLQFMHDFSLSAYCEETNTGEVKGVAVRHIDGALIITIIAQSALQVPLKALNEVLKSKYGNNYALYLNINNKNNNVLFTENFVFIGGNDDKKSYLGKQIFIHPAAFFQVNEGICKTLYNDVATFIQKGEPQVVIDAYSGGGILTHTLADCAKKVYGIELNAKAHEAARRLCVDKDVELICDDCVNAIPLIIKKHSGKRISVVFDPPRAGISPKIIQAVLNGSVDNIVYISCNPATLARDLQLFSTSYTIKSITPYDMFAQTANLETVCVLKRQKKS